MPNKNKQSWEERFEKICPAKCEVFVGEEKITCDFKEYVPRLKSFISQEIARAKQEEREKISREIREDDKVVEEIPQFKGTREALNNLTKLKEE